MVSATVNAMIQPYADPRANFMRMTADASLFFTLLCLMVLHHEEVVQAEEGVDACEVLSIDAVGYILIFINFFCLILVCRLSWHRARPPHPAVPVRQGLRDLIDYENL